MENHIEVKGTKYILKGEIDSWTGSLAKKLLIVQRPNGRIHYMIADMGNGKYGSPVKLHSLNSWRKAWTSQ